MIDVILQNKINLIFEGDSNLPGVEVINIQNKMKIRLAYNTLAEISF